MQKIRKKPSLDKLKNKPLLLLNPIYDAFI